MNGSIYVDIKILETVYFIGIDMKQTLFTRRSDVMWSKCDYLKEYENGGTYVPLYFNLR